MRSEFRTVHRLTVRCPVKATTLRSLADGNADALADDDVIAPILRLIENTPEFGDFGTYSGVCEITVGLEAFTPSALADPTLGQAGQRTVSPTATLTTYLADDLPEDRILELVDRLADAHPWEVPVIERSQIRLRGSAPTSRRRRE